MTASRLVPIQYWQIDEQTLGVVVESGPPASTSCEVVKSDETTDEVHIRAECRTPVFGSGTGAAYRYELRVALAQPLGGRRVLDGLGQPGALCQSPCR